MRALATLLSCVLVLPLLFSMGCNDRPDPAADRNPDPPSEPTLAAEWTLTATTYHYDDGFDTTHVHADETVLAIREDGSALRRERVDGGEYTQLFRWEANDSVFSLRADTPLNTGDFPYQLAGDSLHMRQVFSEPAGNGLTGWTSHYVRR